jgi:hypothetical protein
MLWGVVKNNAMADIGKKCGPSFQGLENAAFAFDPQVNGQNRFIGDKAYQGFRLMRIEVVNDEMPLGDGGSLSTVR